MAIALAPARAADSVSLASPDGALQLKIDSYGGVRLGYEVTFRGRPVLEPSALGLTVDGVRLAEGVALGRPDRYRVDENYAWYGVHSPARDRASGLRLPVRLAKGDLTWTLEARAYHDGVAFRFIVPAGEGKARVPDEATSFRLPAGSTVWYHDFEGHYEATHIKKSIGEVSAGEWAAPPLTFQLPGGAGYGSITEGALFRYAGMGLQADGNRGFSARLGHDQPLSYPFRLRYGLDEGKRLAQAAAITGTITTPWRIVMVGADLNTLVNCDIVHNVALPPDPKFFPRGLETDWIKPGRAVWKYLDGGENTLEEMRNFSQLASELGFEYNLLEGFWQKWSVPELKDFVAYSRERHVGIWLWKHSRDIRDPAPRREFFQLCRDAGVVGAKIDFFDHEAKEVVEFYEAMLRDAAEFHLLIDFHGANKPSGESRTWPNELTREGIRGMEARNVPRALHDATLPFTRMLAGHADYTPVLFGDRRGDTTWAHQIATAAIFTSPLLVYGAHPASLLKNPAVEVIKSLPSVWDETIALPVSAIGEVAAFARRRGDVWFLAILNGPSARSLDIPLTFLGAGPYQALLVRDDPADAAAVVVEKASAGRGEPLRVQLLPGGGFIGRFSK